MAQRKTLHVVNDQFLSPIDWKKCLLCQENKNEHLQKGTRKGLITLADVLQEYSRSGLLPSSIDLSRFNDGRGIADTLICNNAVYHKVCKSEFSMYKLDRFRKGLKTDIIKEAEEEEVKEIEETPSVPGLKECLTRSKVLKKDIKSTCIFCDECEDEKKRLVHAQTLEIGSNIIFMAQKLEDEKILAKLSSPDLVAQEAKYHKICYVKYRTKIRDNERRNIKGDSKNNFHCYAYGSALSQLVDFIESTYTYNPQTSPIFKMNMLTTKMKDAMKSFGVEDPKVHRLRLREHLLGLIPELEFSKSGKDVILFFRESVGNAFRDVVSQNAMSDGMCLARAAKIVRKSIFEDFPPFEGSFCEQFTPTQCVNKSLVLLLQMILEGSFNDDYADINLQKAPLLSLAQLIRFNAVKSKRREETNSIRHSIDRETPLPLYIGLRLYSTSRSKTLIRDFNKLGLCVSYDRVQQVLATTTNRICEEYEETQKVVPLSLHPKVFTTAVIDNIDHNPSSTTASSSFHGTSITIIQHPDCYLKKKTFKIIGGFKEKDVTKQLPASYSEVAPLSCSNKCLGLPLSTVNVESSACDSTFETVTNWLKKILETVEGNNFDSCPENISWSAFSANCNPEKNVMVCNNALMPLLNEKVQSPVVIAHCLLRIRDVYEELNLNSEIMVITGDQPIYALAKQLQWNYPEEFGEDKVVVMMGGLHIEMAVMRMIGSWLSGSGWVDILVNSGITTTGKAEKFLSCSHVKRTRYAHQVTLAALNILKKNAYHKNDTTLNFKNWCDQREEESTQFLYWSTTMTLETLLLSYVQSLREGNYINFKAILTQICPWMFAMDQIHYSRWLPIFVKTLQELETRHPEIHDEFMQGKFVSLKSNREFSCIADDQLHEQNNKVIKGIGGAIGLLENPSTLSKWMIAGPIIAEMISEFQDLWNYNTDDDSDGEKCRVSKHREDNEGFQKMFFKDVLSVVSCFEKYGNPFEEDFLSTALTKTKMPDDSELSVRKARDTGKSSYEKYVNERLVQGSTSVHSVINRNNLILFRDKIKSSKNTLQMRVNELRKDSNVFCKLYIASQIRDSDVLGFFSHENHPYPPSLSEFGNLRKPNKKSEIIKCLTNNTEVDQGSVGIAQCSSLIIDGSVLVHSLPTSVAKTFSEYSEKVFKPAIIRRLSKYKRVDVVFDRYLPNSLKSDTRTKRGLGKPIIVKDCTPLPKSFKKFLSVDENKIQLFNLLASEMSCMELPDKLLVLTKEEMTTSSSGSFNADIISPCSHEEADTRIFLHAKDAVLAGHENICIETVDSDVIVIAIGVFETLKNLGLKELWMDFGVGKNKKKFPLSRIIKDLVADECKALPFFHAFTGCDTVSSFYGIGKMKAWNVWKKLPYMSEVFNRLSSDFIVSESDLEHIQRYTILLYDLTSSTESINECRRILFSQKNRSIENIPPTLEALRQHVNRTMLQSHIWINCLEKNISLPDVTNWGWKRCFNSIEPHWSNLPEASADCKELISCRCKTMCIKNCKCSRVNLPCTSLCACDGQCTVAYL